MRSQDAGWKKPTCYKLLNIYSVSKTRCSDQTFDMENKPAISICKIDY